MNVRLPKKPGSSSRQRNEGTYLALISVFAIGLGLMALMALVLPQVSGLIFVVAGFCGFVALHYFTWGRWLMQWSARQSLKEDEQQPPPHEQQPPPG